MRVGIRTKLVALLAAVALVPLIAALLALAIGGRRLATESFGKMMLLAASAEGTALEAALGSDLERLRLALEHDAAAVVDLAARRAEFPASKLAALDANWPTMPATRPAGPSSRGGASRRRVEPPCRREASPPTA